MEKRLLTQRKAILNILRKAGEKGVTNAELSKTALRYGGSLGDLYAMGYVIKKEHLGNGLYNYILVSEPEEFVKKPKAFDVLMDSVDKLGSIDKKQLEDMLEKIGLVIRYKAGTHQKLI